MNLPIPLKYWGHVREDLYKALDQFNDEQLLFSPGEGLWSLGQIFLHIASAEQGWFRYVITSEANDWPADLELSDFSTIAKIKEVLQNVHAKTEIYLESLDEAELERIITAPWGSEFPVRWAIWHVLEHEIHHRGEIFLMLGMLGKEAPDV